MLERDFDPDQFFGHTLFNLQSWQKKKATEQARDVKFRSGKCFEQAQTQGRGQRPFSRRGQVRRPSRDCSMTQRVQVPNI